jgi:hypothetical protein
MFQAVGGSMAAAAVAAGMLLAPAPASAKLTFGRAADVAEQQVRLCWHIILRGTIAQSWTATQSLCSI